MKTGEVAELAREAGIQYVDDMNKEELIQALGQQGSGSAAPGGAGATVLNSPEGLFLYEVSGMYDGEQRIAQMLSEVAGQVQDENLAQMLRTHEQETRRQITNLERCFEALDAEPQQVTCAAIEGIRTEYEEVVAQQPSPDVLTMFVLGSAMKVEHYEIATYRGLVDKAMLMGETECAQILQTNLVEEEETAGKLERLSHEMSQRMLATA
jgi:ferritin-like metal-binding protein YciE